MLLSTAYNGDMYVPGTYIDLRYLNKPRPKVEAVEAAPKPDPKHRLFDVGTRIVFLKAAAA